LRYYLL